MTDPSADEVRKANMETLASAHAVYVEAMREHCGEEGLEALRQANFEHGLELGKAGIESGGLREGEPKSLFDFFEAAHPYFGFDLELIDHSDDMVEMKVHSCPWIDTFKAKGAEEDICHWVCAMDDGIGRAVDPDLEMSIPKCMMRGDDYCVYLWKK
jgi:predicted hydrocarbon binding protein